MKKDFECATNNTVSTMIQRKCNIFILLSFFVPSLIASFEEQSYSSQCYEASLPPAILTKLVPRVMTDDEWVDYSVHGWGIQCCNASTGKYQNDDGECLVPQIIGPIIMKSYCAGISVCFDDMRR